VLQAEDYRSGGEGVGYHDTTAGNTGGGYRSDNVDIQATTDAGGGYNVGWIAAGEWLAFDVNVPTAGSFIFTLRYATPTTGRKAHIEVDGVNVTGSIALPSTGGNQTWANAASRSVPLSAGNHVVKIVLENNGWNLNYVSVTSSNQATQLPGVLQAEDYRSGGEGVGYYDTTAGNWTSPQSQDVAKNLPPAAESYHEEDVVMNRVERAGG